MSNYQEGDLILCKVKDVVKTTVFVETLDGVKGSIVFSEVAPGRLRNIRVYAVPNKIIACKILSIRDNHLFLSLRRVKENEKRDLMEKHKKELTWESILKKIIKEDASKIINKIRENHALVEFFESAKENIKVLESYFTKNQITEVSKILQEKKEKEKELKKEFKLSCKESDGILRIKKILSPYNNIVYLGSSKFVIKIKTFNLKQASSEINQILENIEKQAKKQKCEFDVKK